MRARHSRKPPGQARSDGCCRRKMQKQLEFREVKFFHMVIVTMQTTVLVKD